MNSHPAFELPDQTTIVCIALGLVIVALYSMQNFEESTVKKGEDDFIAQLLPRYLATRREYSRALIGYMGSMFGIFCAMSALGPRLLDALPPTVDPFKPVAPLGFALLLVGVLPYVPWLQDIEWHVRRFWHERAYIPAAARATADTLRASSFNFSAYKSDAVFASPLMRGIERTDFEAPRGSIEYGWARLSCLLYELGRRRDAGDTESLDGEMLDRYARDLDNISSKRQALEADVAQYRQETARNRFYENNQLRTNIADALRQLHILLGCAVRLKANRTTDINAAFRSFGFVLGPSTPPDDHQNLIIVGLTVMTASLLALVFAGLVTGYLFKKTGLWQPSAHFPKDAIQPFIWSLSGLVVQGVAIMTADWMRVRLLRKGRWFVVVGQERQPIAANYIRVGLCCVVTGYIALYMWSIIFQPPSIHLAKAIAAFALLPAATGAFYGYHLDNVELGRRPLRSREIGSQTLLTALCGLMATPVWFALDDDAAGNTDVIVLVTLFGAVVGASLAWYLPKAAASPRYEPLAAAKEERMAMLRAAALDRFRNKELAKRWLEQRNSDLDNRAPEDAAADIELFPKVLGLLQQVRLVAAA